MSFDILSIYLNRTVATLIILEFRLIEQRVDGFDQPVSSDN